MPIFAVKTRVLAKTEPKLHEPLRRKVKLKVSRFCEFVNIAMPKRGSVRAVIFSCLKNGVSVKDAIAYLTRTFGNKAPSRRTIYRWYRRFAAGTETFEDAPKVVEK